MFKHLLVTFCDWDYYSIWASLALHLAQGIHAWTKNIQNATLWIWQHVIGIWHKHKFQCKVQGNKESNFIHSTKKRGEKKASILHLPNDKICQGWRAFFFFFKRSYQPCFWNWKNGSWRQLIAYRVNLSSGIWMRRWKKSKGNEIPRHRTMILLGIIPIGPLSNRPPSKHNTPESRRKTFFFLSALSVENNVFSLFPGESEAHQEEIKLASLGVIVSHVLQRHTFLLSPGRKLPHFIFRFKCTEIISSRIITFNMTL